MVSRTKPTLAAEQVRALFQSAGYKTIEKIEPLGAGEFSAVCAATADGKRCVIKISPETTTAVMTHETEMMKTELFWYDRIREHTDIRVPEVYFSAFDQKLLPVNFFIMERLDGTHFARRQKTEADSCLAGMAAQIHSIKNDRFGYVQCGLRENWYLAVREMVLAALSDGARVKKNRNAGRRCCAT